MDKGTKVNIYVALILVGTTIAFILIMSALINFALSIPPETYTERTTQYQVINISISHQEATFWQSSSKDYLSVIYLDDNGNIKQLRDDDIGGISVVIGNRTALEKKSYYNQNNISHFWDNKYVLIVRSYSEIK